MLKIIKEIIKFCTKYKKIAMIFLLIALILYYFLTPAFYIMNSNGDIAIKLPHYITVTKNCKKYRNFIHSIAAPLFVPSDDCPWQDVEPIAHFQVGDVTFNIPRQYLWQGKRNPDGRQDQIYAIARYPAMERGWADGDEFGNLDMRKHNIVFEIYFDHSRKICMDKKKVNPEIKCISRKDKITKRYNLRKIKYHDDLGLTEYRMDNYDSLYVKNSIDDLRYWLECERYRKRGSKSNSPLVLGRCKTNFIYDDYVNIYYRFHAKDQLKNHADIRNKMIDLINRFASKDKSYASNLKVNNKKNHKSQ